MIKFTATNEHGARARELVCCNYGKIAIPARMRLAGADPALLRIADDGKLHPPPTAKGDKRRKNEKFVYVVL